jgi:hypothetical protein
MAAATGTRCMNSTYKYSNVVWGVLVGADSCG